MKKSVFTLLVFFVIAISASAQTEEGNWMVGGNLELNTAKTNTTIVFSPMLGYFFANNFAAGAMVDLDYMKRGDSKTTTWGFGPFARYYFGTMNIRPLIHGQWSYISTKTTSVSNGSEFFVAGGLAAFINRNVAIEGLAGYDYTKLRHSGTGSGGFKMKIGFQVYINRGTVQEMTR
jgi:hypothetical protein